MSKIYGRNDIFGDHRHGEYGEVDTSTFSEVLDDDEFTDACDIATESALSDQLLQQTMTVSDRLETGRSMCQLFLEKPDRITPELVVMATESMHLALAALGQPVGAVYMPSTESAVDSPVRSMEVAEESFSSTIKKIKKGTGILFDRIVLTIKKLTAKLVVALNRTSAKAESMLKDLKEFGNAKESKLTEEDALKYYENLAGYLRIKKVADFATDPLGVMTKNMKAIADFELSAANDEKLYDTALTDETALNNDREGTAKLNETALSKKVLSAMENANSIKYKIAISFAKDKTGGIDDIGSGSVKLALDSADLEDISLSDDYEADSLGFYPTYVSGTKIHGVLFYVRKNDDTEKDKDAAHFLSLVRYTNVSIEGLTSDEQDDKAKGKVKSKTDIKSELNEFKSASKRLKIFSDNRIKDIDRAMKVVNVSAKKVSGFTVINRLRSNSTTKIKLFISGNYVSSIFAFAKLQKSQLALIAHHMSYYDGKD